jgi:uncharacterized membrane-anchored protein YjiN (DUF445 family)
LVLRYGPTVTDDFGKTELAMAMRDGRPGSEEVRKRIQELRHEIEELRKVDHEKRLSRESQVPWDALKQHEARVARMDEIKEELLKLGRGLK